MTAMTAMIAMTAMLSTTAMLGTIAALFAANLDWLEAILPILFVGFWIISQIVGVMRRVAGGGAAEPPVVQPELQRELARRRLATPRLPGNTLQRRLEVAPDDQRAGQTELAREIEEFLRPHLPKPKPQVARASPTQQTQRTPVHGKQAQRLSQPPLPIDRKEPSRASRGTVERPMGSLDARQTEVARHVQDAFSHELKHLALGLGKEEPSSENASPQPAAVTPAVELAHLLRNPVTIRQVILLREVLERPVSRW